MKKQTEVKHTPTPWILNRVPNSGIIEIVSSDVSEVAAQTNYNFDGRVKLDWQEAAEANAELIVRAVNSYDEHKKKMLDAADCIETLQKRNDALMEAAKCGLAALEHITNYTGDETDEARPEIRNLRKAIAQAEGL